MSIVRSVMLWLTSGWSESVAASSLEAYPPPTLRKMLTYISNATAASTTPNTRLFIRRSTLISPASWPPGGNSVPVSLPAGIPIHCRVAKENPFHAIFLMLAKRWLQIFALEQKQGPRRSRTHVKDPRRNLRLPIGSGAA
jgi:hypothetical protein